MVDGWNLDYGPPPPRPHAHIHTCIHAQLHTEDTYIHTYIHTYIRVYVVSTHVRVLPRPILFNYNCCVCGEEEY